MENKEIRQIMYANQAYSFGSCIFAAFAPIYTIVIFSVYLKQISKLNAIFIVYLFAALELIIIMCFKYAIDKKFYRNDKK